MFKESGFISSVEEVRLKRRRDANKAYAERIASIVLRNKVDFSYEIVIE